FLGVTPLPILTVDAGKKIVRRGRVRIKRRRLFGRCLPYLVIARRRIHEAGSEEDGGMSVGQAQVCRCKVWVLVNGALKILCCFMSLYVNRYSPYAAQVVIALEIAATRDSIP